MIVSASRRTDFCAFFAEQFRNDFERGFTNVANPFNRQQIRRISLRREDVDCFVFWTRWPLPFFANFQRLQENGFPFYLLLTYNGYPSPLERGLPVLKDILYVLQRFKKEFVASPVYWRYDPIVICEDLNPDYHYQNFLQILKVLSPFISGIIVSFLDLYFRVIRRLKKNNLLSKIIELNEKEQNNLICSLREIAKNFNLDLQTCARPGSIFPGKCISDQIISKLSNKLIVYKKDPAQRPLCLCQESVDIGQYATCRFNCLYCYAC